MAYKRLENVGDRLIQAKTNFPRIQPGVSGIAIKNYFEPCQKTNCTLCQKMTYTRIRSSQSKRSYTLSKLATKATCQTTNVIYCITCSGCNKQYIGETKRTFKIRISEHLADIRLKRDKPVANHFNRPEHNMTLVNYQVVEVINRDPSLDTTTVFRRQRESFWIAQLRTLQPQGINEFA